MIGLGVELTKTRTTIEVSGALIVLLLVVKLYDCETGVKVGLTLGVGTVLDSGGGTLVDRKVGIKMGPILGDSIVGEGIFVISGVVRIVYKGVTVGTLVDGTDERDIGLI